MWFHLLHAIYNFHFFIRFSVTLTVTAIKAINAGYKDDQNGYKVEVSQFGECFGTADFHEGTSAFLEKRKANFKGI